MLAGRSEIVQVTRPSGSGQKTSYTGEVMAGGSLETRNVSVVFLVGTVGALLQRQAIAYAHEQGAVIGESQDFDAVLLSQPTGSPDDIDWGEYVRPEVTVIRAGQKFQPVSMAASTLSRHQLVMLKKRDTQA